jgi:hypothetical protein
MTVIVEEVIGIFNGDFGLSENLVHIYSHAD